MAEHEEPTGASEPENGSAASRQRDDRAEAESDVDPELLSIRGPRPRIGVLLSLSIVVLCSYVLLRLWPDLQFAMTDREPEVLAEPGEALSIAPESYVEIPALAVDRAAAIRLSHSADRAIAAGHRVAPVRGAGGALWVAVEGNPRRAPIRHDETHVGRLRTLADLPFAGSLERYASSERAPHFITAAALREAVSAGADEVRTPAGDAVAVTAQTPVVIAETVAGEAEITAVATDDYPSAERWAHALAEAGALPGLRPPIAAGDGIWVFSAPGNADELNATLADARLIGASAEQVERVHEAAFGALEASAAALGAGDQTVPWESIDGVWLEVKTPVAPGAMILLDGERPGDYRHVMWVSALLAAFALLFAWAFVYGLRRELAASRPPPPPPISGNSDP